MDEEKKLAMTVFLVYIFLLMMNIFNKQTNSKNDTIYYDENRIGNFITKNLFEGYWSQKLNKESVLKNNSGKMEIVLFFGETDTDNNYKFTQLHNQWVLYAKFYDPLYIDGEILEIKQRIDMDLKKGESIQFTQQKSNYNNFYYFNNLSLTEKIFCELDIDIKLNNKVLNKEGIDVQKFYSEKDLWTVQIKSKSKKKQCQLEITGNLQKTSDAELNKKEFIYNLVSIIIISASLYGALKSIKKITQDNNFALKLSLHTIELICLQHSFILFFNLQIGFSIINVFNYFYMYFWYVLLFCFIDQRILVYVWQLQIQNNNPEISVQELKKKSCFYQLKFILLLVFYNYFMNRFLLHPILIILNSLILLPQIIHNSKSQEIWVFDKEYLVFFISSAYLMFFYLRGFDDNIVNLKPYFFEVTLGFVFLFFQLLILYGQDIYGCTFLVPKIISKQYDYFITLKQYKNIMKTFEMQEIDTDCDTKEDTNEANSFFTQDYRENYDNCVICLESLHISVEGEDDLQNKNFKRILKKVQNDKIMCSPCNHAFHPCCLLKWMEVKMKCPYCRSDLPNVVYQLNINLNQFFKYIQQMDSSIFQYLKRQQKIYNKNQVELTHGQKNWIFYFFIVIQILLIIYYALGVDYSFDTKPTDDAASIHESIENMNILYPSFQDVQVMVFIGFGFLMAYLKYHAWSSISFNFIIAAISIQFSIVCIHFWESIFKSEWHKLQLNLPFLIRGDFAAATVLISYGAVIGKFNLGQYMMMGFLEVIFSTLNQVICEYEFRAIDMGGSMYIHAFGAYFGLAVVTAYKFKEAENNKHNTSGYISNTFALLATVFLFMYWPSFNSALAIGPGRQRIVINTFFSIVASVISVFIVSPIWNDGKLSIDNVLNSTIAGGVAAGTSADLVDGVYVSILTGFLAGVICCLGFSFLAAKLSEKFGLQDTAGVNNLHGMPGIFSAIVATICVATMSIEDFQTSVGLYFEVKTERSSGEQAGYQFLSLIVTLIIALVSGFVVGKILSLKIFNESQYLFSDINYWIYEDEENDDDENIEKTLSDKVQEQEEFEKGEDLERVVLKNNNKTYSDGKYNIQETKIVNN